MTTNCPLCRESASYFNSSRGKEYFECPTCGAVFLAPQYYPSLKDEKDRYLTHNNDINNAGYQEFVRPIVECTVKHFNKDHLGLDFGCGTGPVISKLLQDRGYNIKQYDPFFFDRPEHLQKIYDYIICSEVVEHFHNPAKEFKLLRSMLKSGGKLFCQTERYSPKIDFKNWYYKNDSTHVFFYQKQTFDWIRANFNFFSLAIEGRLAVFTA
ncbi:MAG: class I SAM-dependent methyltransferase [Candidatus Saganbacteria bacterium]|nr:class I SAM-dependent methyltransferase [Candidatus Saganbacteria bacterium]